MPHTNSKDAFPDTTAFPIAEGTANLAPTFSVASASHRRLDTRDQMRMRRLAVIALFAALYLLVLTEFYVQDLLEGDVLAGISICVGLAMLGLYVVFASGLNRKASEPNLTAPIGLCAVAIMLGTLYVAPDTRAVYAPFVFIVIAYGMYRLTQAMMLLLNVVALVGYALVIGLHWLQDQNPAALKLAVLDWLVMAITLPGFVLLTGRVRRLYNALHRAGMKIRNIEEHARRDPLIGCYNRRYMIAMLEEQKRLADENGQPLCLAVIDLDHFKSINDSAGHLAGDEVLRTFARIAQENVRQDDVFGRYGGEEFLLILPQTRLLSALNTAERIREQIENHAWHDRLQRTVTVSIGLTQYIAGESVLDLFARTDTAMYLAKRGGRNQVVVEEPGKEL